MSLNQIDILISGGFGLLVAVVTVVLARWFDLSSKRDDRLIERRKTMEDLYSDHITMLERIIRCTSVQGDYAELSEDLARSNSRLRLMAPESVIRKSEETSELMFSWTRDFCRGAPKRVRDLGVSIVSEYDSEHAERAKKLYPVVNESIIDLIRVMRKELDAITERSGARSK